MKKALVKASIVIVLLTLILSCEKEKVNYLPSIDKPIDLKASKNEYVELIKLTWTQVPKADIYEIYRFDSLLNEYDKIGSTSELFYEDISNQIPGQNYYYKIRVFNSESKFSEFSEFDYGSVAVFEVPELMAVILNEEFVELKWNKTIGSDEYQIFKADAEDGTFKYIGKTEVETFIDNDVIPAKMYFYKIKSKNMVLGESGFSSTMDGYCLETYNMISSFGSYGMASGQLSHPIGVVVDNQNNIYVSENWDSRRVQKFDQDGKYLATITTGDNPYGILFYNENLFISKNTPGKIYCFNLTGEILYDWGNGYGAGEDQFKGVWSMTFDTPNNMYVVDRDNDRIKKFDQDKKLVSIWNGFDNPYGLLFVNDKLLISDSNGLFEYSTDGTILSTLDIHERVTFISKDASGNIYLACSNYVLKLNPQYKVIAKIEGFEWAYSLTINQNNELLVSDYNKHKIFKYSLEE